MFSLNGLYFPLIHHPYKIEGQHSATQEELQRAQTQLADLEKSREEVRTEGMRLWERKNDICREQIGAD